MAIGTNAMKEHTTGADNIAIGFAAMDGTQAGGTQSTSAGSVNNIFIGTNSGGGAWTNTASNYNIAIGYQAMDGALAGANENVAMGNEAGGGITSGDANTLVGSASGYAISTGHSNVAIGKDTMFTAAAVDKCVAIGYKALNVANDDAADGTVAIGYQAGYRSVPTATVSDLGDLAGNTLIGYSAGFDVTNTQGLTTGIQNTVVGYEALGGLCGGSGDITGDANTVMGYRAGRLIKGASTRNTILGALAGDAITTGANNIAIGYSADCSATETNQTSLGYFAISQNRSETRLGAQGGVQFYSASESLLGGNNSTDVGAAHTGYLFKIPASSIIKSVTVVVTELSNLAVHNFAVYLSTDTTRSLNEALTASGRIELLGVGAASSCNATVVDSTVAIGDSDPDIITGTDSGVANQTYHSKPDFAFGAAAKYVWIAAAGTGNTAAIVSDAAIVRICVEFIGQD